MNKNFFATYRNDVGKISTPFAIKPTPDAKMQIQRETTVPIHCKEKLNAFWDVLPKNVETDWLLAS